MERGRRYLGKSAADAPRERKSAPWKVALAVWLKGRTQVSNRWLCEQLHMGTPVSVSQLAGRARRENGPAAKLVSALNENIRPFL